MVDIVVEEPDVVQPYRGELLGIGVVDSHFAAFGPGVHIVCKSKEQACEVAAGLNAAYIFGILSQRSKQ